LRLRAAPSRRGLAAPGCARATLRENDMNPKQDESRAGPVLLYDGACGLCNRAVRFLLGIDRRGVLRFCTLQGGPGQAWLRAHGLPPGDRESMVFVRDWNGGGNAGRDAYALRTGALVAALEACGGAGRVLAWIRFVPRPLRDGGYRLIARLRYRLFGEWKARPLPRPEWQDRFIDGPPFWEGATPRPTGRAGQ
jgi:predicted DCC family thiol-disulfide oxidoreductase YuxK